MTSTDSRIHLAERDGVATMTLDDGRANVIGRAFLSEMDERLDEIFCRRAKASRWGSVE